VKNGVKPALYTTSCVNAVHRNTDRFSTISKTVIGMIFLCVKRYL